MCISSVHHMFVHSIVCLICKHGILYIYSLTMVNVVRVSVSTLTVTRLDFILQYCQLSGYILMTVSNIWH